MEIKKIFIPAFGATLNILSLLFLNFAVLRPNRIMTGTSVFAKEYFNNFYYVLIFVSFLILILIFIKENLEIINIIVASTTSIYTCVLVYLFGIMANQNVMTLGEFGRVSIGIGFWVSIISSYIIIVGSLTERAFYKTIKRILLLVIFIFVSITLYTGLMNDVSIIKEYMNRKDAFWNQVLRHLVLAASSTLFGVVIGIPLAVYIYKRKTKNNIILYLINIGQTVPTLSLLGLIMIPLTIASDNIGFLKAIGISGFGIAPSFIILVIYALFPIVYNTMAGLKLVNEDILEAGVGMGMKKQQVLFKIHIPLSFPVILGGIRTAFTQSIGNTILAGLIGGGGLGSIIFLGLAQSAPDLIMLGVIPLVMMALIIDFCLNLIIEMTRKRKKMQYLNYEMSEQTEKRFILDN